MQGFDTLGRIFFFEHANDQIVCLRTRWHISVAGRIQPQNILAYFFVKTGSRFLTEMPIIHQSLQHRRCLWAGAGVGRGGFRRIAMGLQVGQRGAHLAGQRHPLGLVYTDASVTGGP